jgi:hypothetical protein
VSIVELALPSPSPRRAVTVQELVDTHYAKEELSRTPSAKCPHGEWSNCTSCKARGSVDTHQLRAEAVRGSVCLYVRRFVPGDLHAKDMTPVKADDEVKIGGVDLHLSGVVAHTGRSLRSRGAHFFTYSKLPNLTAKDAPPGLAESWWELDGAAHRRVERGELDKPRGELCLFLYVRR